MEIDRQKETEALKESRLHADEVRKQIREKEQARISARRAFFEEGIKMEEEARLRRARLDEVSQRSVFWQQYAENVICLNFLRY